MENNKKKELMRTIKFTLFSLSAGIIQIALFELLDKVFELSYWLAYTPSLIASVVWNFTFNRKFTFKSAANVPTAMLKALLFYVWFTPITVLGGNYLVEQCRPDDLHQYVPELCAGVSVAEILCIQGQHRHLRMRFRFIKSIHCPLKL